MVLKIEFMNDMNVRNKVILKSSQENKEAFHPLPLRLVLLLLIVLIWKVCFKSSTLYSVGWLTKEVWQLKSHHWYNERGTNYHAFTWWYKERRLLPARSFSLNLKAHSIWLWEQLVRSLNSSSFFNWELRLHLPHLWNFVVVTVLNTVVCVIVRLILCAHTSLPLLGRF